MSDQIAPGPAGGSVAVPGTRHLGFVGQDFPLGHWFKVRRLDTATLTAVVADFDRDFPVVGDWYSDEIHLIDMSLSGRLCGTRAACRCGPHVGVAR